MVDTKNLNQIVSNVFNARKKYYFQQQLLDLHAPYMANHLNISVEIDRCYMQPMIRAVTAILEGETVEESKTIELIYKFNVFKSWTDHLKFRIQRKLPRKLQKYLKINYIKIVKNQAYAYNLKVSRCCPHHESTYENRPDVHLHYMFPTRYKECQP